MTRRTLIGALAGFVVAFALTLAMPVRYSAKATITLHAGAPASLPRGVTYTPSAQLYGPLGPRRAPATLSATVSAPTRALALERARRALPQAGRVTIRRSPERLRDLLLGLLAGGLLALALAALSTNKWRGYSSW